jgi:hypothetical protein
MHIADGDGGEEGKGEGRSRGDERGRSVEPKLLGGLLGALWMESMGAWGKRKVICVSRQFIYMLLSVGAVGASPEAVLSAALSGAACVGVRCVQRQNLRHRGMEGEQESEIHNT